MAAPVNGSGPKRVTIPNSRVLLRSRRAGRAGACRRSRRSSRRLGQPVVSASARGRSNQRKGGYHERKQGKRLGELTGFTFERNNVSIPIKTTCCANCLIVGVGIHPPPIKILNKAHPLLDWSQSCLATAVGGVNLLSCCLNWLHQLMQSV